MSNTTAASSIHRAVWDWLGGCVSITKLFFNFGTQATGSTIIIPSDSQTETYIDGTEMREYAVELIRFLPLTFDVNSTANIDMLEDVDAIAKWIEEQEAGGNYPLFPIGMTVQGIELTNSYSGYTLGSDGLYAKYTIPFKIIYEKGVIQ